jgi:hypothetical protein
MKKEEETKENKGKDTGFNWDIKRTFILGSYGFIMLGPMFGVWYNRILPRLAPMDFSLPKKQLMV